MLKYTAIALNHRIFCNSTEIKEAPSELGKYSVRKSHQVNNFFFKNSFFYRATLVSASDMPSVKLKGIEIVLLQIKN